uniref:Nucleoside diphosphate kinase n=1 Tax=Eptatretus burgeri TaxID=7764 RepID=A0A8C4X0J4_EPTBU
MWSLVLALFSYLFKDKRPSWFERTLVILKPDGLQRALSGEVLSRFEQRGLQLVAAKLIRPSAAHLKQHYWELRDKPFFTNLVTFMSSGPIIAMVWQGTDAVAIGRAIIGATDPMDALPGTIRGDLCITVGRCEEGPKEYWELIGKRNKFSCLTNSRFRNVVHGSDSVESAKHEIDLWFKPAELVMWERCCHDWVFESPSS